MITEVKEKRVISFRDVDDEYDGKWVVYDSDPYSTSGDFGCVIAYGEDTPEDREALHKIVIDRFRGQALLKYAYVPKEDIIFGQYDIGVAAKPQAAV